MNFGVFWILTIFFSNSNKHANAIDDKLDFGGAHSSSHSFIRDRPVHRSTFVPVKQTVVSKLENNDDFDNIGVVCGDGGCNTTTSNNDSDDTIKTDVVVHVQTKVDVKHNKTQPIDDTPDVPIVIGTDDSNSNSNDYNGFNGEPKSIYIPGNGPDYPRVDVGTGTDSYGKFYPSSMSGNSFYPSSRDDSINSFRDLDSGINVNIKTLPPIAVDLDGSTRNMFNPDYNNYKSNGVELTVPYFDSSLHSHYYGETPPPQSAFYPRRTSITNPVEFKIMRPAWRPSTWQNQFGSPRNIGVMSIPTGKVCACPNGETGAEVHIYPNSNRRGSTVYENTKSSINDPGAQINDKLGPLN